MGEQRSAAAQHSTAQHSTAQHSTAQHSTAQHSTAQHSYQQCLERSLCNAGPPPELLQQLHAGYSLVLALVDELLKGFLQRIAELLVLLEGLSKDSVQLYLHLQQS